MEPRNVLAALAIKCNGEWNKIYESIKSRNTLKATEIISILENNKTKFITIIDDEYPTILKNIYKPPIVLFYKGDISLLKSRRLLGVVGSRNCSNYGKYVTKKLISELDKDIVVVSGLARGIDYEGHVSALKNGNPTIAFLGCGINYIYPTENYQLYKDIERNGLLISEYPDMCPPDKQNFPFRNRLIAGLCKGILVSEGKNCSGTSTTVTAAAAFGKTVFAVPSPIDEENESLTNNLIRDGAVLVRKGEDINEEI